MQKSDKQLQEQKGECVFFLVVYPKNEINRILCLYNSPE